MNKDLESTLRSQHWCDPPPAFLERVLQKSLEESRQRPGVLQPSGAFERPQADAKPHSAGAVHDVVTPKRRHHILGLLSFIPRPLRFPLAACWLLAFFFLITTPEAIPQSTLSSYAKLPPLTPAQLLSSRKQVERLAHELLHPQHHGPIPPL